MTAQPIEELCQLAAKLTKLEINGWETDGDNPFINLTILLDRGFGICFFYWYQDEILFVEEFSNDNGTYKEQRRFPMIQCPMSKLEMIVNQYAESAAAHYSE